MRHRYELNGAESHRSRLRASRPGSLEPMTDDALSMAVRLSRAPNLSRNLRFAPLPDGMNLVIRIAGGCEESCSQAAAQTGLDPQTVARMSMLYLLIVLFDQRSDSYRTLGLTTGATMDEIRDHKNWLLKWLHPDRNPNQWVGGLAVRVLGAWQELSSHPDTQQELQPEPEPLVAIDVQEPRRRRRLKGHIWVPLE